MPAWARALINGLYVLCAVAGIVAGVYGLYVLVAHVIIIEELNFAGLAFGAPLTAGGFGLFAYARNRLFGAWYRKDRYKPRTWAVTLLGLVGSCLSLYPVVPSDDPCAI